MSSCFDIKINSSQAGPFEELQSLIAASIEELVMIKIHFENLSPEDAKECLTTVHLNVVRLAEIVETEITSLESGSNPNQTTEAP
jgi:hypothetical protein